MTPTDPLIETVSFLRISLSVPVPVDRRGTRELLWMDQSALRGVLVIAQLRRDRHAEAGHMDPEFERKLIKLLRVMVRNQYKTVGDVPINKIIPIATGTKLRRPR